MRCATAGLLLLAGLLGAQGAAAETRAPGLFSYTGQLSGAVTHVGWELSPGKVQSEGFSLAFWGSADPAAGCPASLQDGAMTSNIFWTNVQADTGLSLGSANEQWAPKSDFRCTYSEWQGFSHAHVRNSSTDGGIGLYSHTGPKPTDPSAAFFQPYAGTGDRNGANPYIQGLFANFRNTPWSPSSSLTRPFSGNSSDRNLLRMAIRSHQGLVKFTMEDPARQQVRQQTSLTFLHLGCFFNNPNAAKKCQLQYLLFNAISGTGSSVSGVLFDPSQGNIPAVHGSMGSAGQTTVIQGVPVWTSWAAPTQSSTWAGQKWFQAEVSFNQFLGMLRYISGQLQKDVEVVFGPAHDDRNQWILLDVGVAHEVYNPSHATRRAYVGGNVTELSVIALPY